MRQPSDFSPWILPFAPGVPAPIAAFYVVEAARQWCRATRCWRESQDIPGYVSGEEVLAVPACAAIFEIEEASFNGCRLTPVPYREALSGCDGQTITQAAPDTLIAHTGGASGTLSLSLFLEPMANAPLLPAMLYEHWGREIAHGALADMLLIPGQPFTSIDMAGYFRGLFEADRNREFNRNGRGQHRAPKRMRGVYA